MKHTISLILIVLLAMPLPVRAAHEKAEGNVLEGIKEMGMIVSVFSPDMDISEDDVKKHVYAKLASNLPLLKIASLSYPYLDVHVHCTGKIERHRSCYLEMELRRIVYLADKETLIAATVWNKGSLLQGDITFFALMSQLDQLLNIFTRDYVQAMKRHEGEVR